GSPGRVIPSRHSTCLHEQNAAKLWARAAAGGNSAGKTGRSWELLVPRMGPPIRSFGACLAHPFAEIVARDSEILHSGACRRSPRTSRCPILQGAAYNR